VFGNNIQISIALLGQDTHVAVSNLVNVDQQHDQKRMSGQYLALPYYEIKQKTTPISKILLTFISKLYLNVFYCIINSHMAVDNHWCVR
jgi:hypothetical protein